MLGKKVVEKILGFIGVSLVGCGGVSSCRNITKWMVSAIQDPNDNNRLCTDKFKTTK